MARTTLVSSHRDARQTGQRGESLAARFLEKEGLRILQRNYRAKQGEIDIVAMDGPVLVFCEVKARSDTEFGEPEEAVTCRKQRQMKRAAAAYLYDHGLIEQECRFDVVAILLNKEPPDVRYFKNAFYL